MAADDLDLPAADFGWNDDDEREQPEQTVIAAVFKGAVLGVAFMEGSTLRFAQVPDADFSMLQSIKYQLKPSLIVAPSTSDPSWWDALSTPCLLTHGPASAAAAAAADDLMAVDEGGEGGGGPRVLALKNRDFSAESAAKRLSLLRTLSELPDCDMSERELLTYLEARVQPHSSPRRSGPRGAGAHPPAPAPPARRSLGSTSARATRSRRAAPSPGCSRTCSAPTSRRRASSA
jgi:hypothetical protein